MKLVMSAQGVVTFLITAGMRSPRLAGFVPTRMKGFETGLGTCQATFMLEVGSAPKEMWRPKGTTDCPLTGVDVKAVEKAERVGVGAGGALAPAWPFRSVGTATTAPAPASPPLRMVRRDCCWPNHSCCSARLSLRARSRVIRVVGIERIVTSEGCAPCEPFAESPRTPRDKSNDDSTFEPLFSGSTPVAGARVAITACEVLTAMRVGSACSRQRRSRATASRRSAALTESRSNCDGSNDPPTTRGERVCLCERERRSLCRYAGGLDESGEGRLFPGRWRDGPGDARGVPRRRQGGGIGEGALLRSRQSSRSLALASR